MLSPKDGENDMNNKLIAGGTITGLVLATGIAGMVSAQTVAAETGLTADQIMELALQEVPGDVTEMDRDREDGQTVWEVEIMTADGTEMEVILAADTGDIIEVAAEDDDKDCDRDDDGEDA